MIVSKFGILLTDVLTKLEWDTKRTGLHKLYKPWWAEFTRYLYWWEVAGTSWNLLSYVQVGPDAAIIWEKKKNRFI